MKYNNITNQKFNRLTATEYVGKDGSGGAVWLCRCDCGKYKNVRAANLRNGQVKSCGCLRDEKVRQRFSKELGICNFNNIYGTYKRAAYRRNLVFNLSTEYFKCLINKPCYYCGKEPSQIMSMPNTNGSFVYNGIDRLDNDVGYTLENCVPCCGLCNWMKKDLKENDFIAHIRKIYINMVDTDA